MDLDHRLKLWENHFAHLQPGSKVYVSTWAISGPGGVIYPDVPALVVGVEGSNFVFIYIDENGTCKQGQLNIADYDRTWEASIDISFRVKIPGGYLLAALADDGCGVDVYRQDESGLGQGFLFQTFYSSVQESVWLECLSDQENERTVRTIPLNRIAQNEIAETPISRDVLTSSAAQGLFVNAGFNTYIFNRGVLQNRVFHTKGAKRDG